MIDKNSKEYGFTLIEIMITFVILMVAMGLAGYGVGVVFRSQVESMANDLTTEFRDLRYRSVSEFKYEYELVFIYENEQYGYEVRRREVNKEDENTGDVVKKKLYPSGISIERRDKKEDGPDEWISLTDSSIDIKNKPEAVTFPFDSSTGGIGDKRFGGEDITSLPEEKMTLGCYKLSNNSKEVTLTIIKLTGRVKINDQ